MPKKRKGYKRILLKISGEVLGNEKGQGIDTKALNKIAKEIVNLSKHKIEVAIVNGGGNIWRYRDTKDAGIERRPRRSPALFAMAIHHRHRRLGDLVANLATEAVSREHSIFLMRFKINGSGPIESSKAGDPLRERSADHVWCIFLDEVTPFDRNRLLVGQALCELATRPIHQHTLRHIEP